MEEKLVQKILNEYKKDKILFKAFEEYLEGLQEELRRHDEFENVRDTILSSLINITKDQNMVFTYRIKILNKIKDFDIKEVYSGNIKNINDITQDNVNNIVEVYIRKFFL